MNKQWLKNIGKVTLLPLIWGCVFGWVGSVQAAQTLTMSDTLTRLKVSTLSDHDIRFVTPTGVDASTDTITLTFTGFTMGTFNVNNVDLAVSATSACTTFATDKTLAAAAGAGVWGVAQAGQVITLTAPTNATTGEITAGVCVQVQVGSNATTGAAGATQITNPASTGAQIVSIGGTLGDSGSLAVAMVDDDVVTPTATVNPTITFDIDAAATNSETAAPYTVPLGTLTSGTLTTSNGTTINSIFLDIDTNAPGGASITVKGANGGIKSTTTTPPKTITTTGEATIAAGTEGFGLCVSTVAQTTGTLARGTQFDSGGNPANCTTANGGTPTVGGVTTSPVEILNSSSAAIIGGVGTVLVKSAISTTTPAANNYTEVLTFIATGTF